MKRINTNIPYRECAECKKPIRYWNNTGVCSNCQNKRNQKKLKVVKFEDEKKNNN